MLKQTAYDNIINACLALECGRKSRAIMYLNCAIVQLNISPTDDEIELSIVLKLLRSTIKEFWHNIKARAGIIQALNVYIDMIECN